MYKPESINEILNSLERAVKRLDAIDFSIISASGFAIGALFGAIYSRIIRKIAPILALIGFLGTAFIIIKLFFKDSVPYIKTR